MEEYELLGIEESSLKGLNPDDMMRIIKKQYKHKLDELIKKIRETLENKELSKTDKLSKIEEITEDVFEFACAFSRIEKRVKGENVEGQETQSVKSEVQSIREMLGKAMKFSEPKVDTHSTGELDESATRTVNAYQALAVSENYELNDQKVAAKTILLLDTAISKKPPYTTDESEKMLFKAFKYIWAYSKLKNPELRKEYASNIKYSQMLSYGVVQKAINETGRENLASTEIVDPKTAKISLSEDGKSILEITERQRLYSSDFTMITTGLIIQYLIRKMENGEITERQVYSIIDMNKLETDTNYRKKMIQLFTDEKNIRLVQKYLGGYIGVVREENGEFNVKYAPKHIGLCVQYQRQQRKKKENPNNGTPPAQSEDGR